jgi:hypothetical protein
MLALTLLLQVLMKQQGDGGAKCVAARGASPHAPRFLQHLRRAQPKSASAAQHLLKLRRCGHHRLPLLQLLRCGRRRQAVCRRQQRLLQRYLRQQLAQRLVALALLPVRPALLLLRALCCRLRHLILILCVIISQATQTVGSSSCCSRGQQLLLLPHAQP